jgi:FKBP-type peptidyl-prolyl cis-trans isomerase
LRWKIAFLTSMLLAACKPGGEAPAALANEEEKTAYALGFQLGRNLVPLELAPGELEAVKRGIADAAAGREAAVAVETYEDRIEQLAARRATRMAAERKTAEADFLAKVAAEPGAQRFDSGLVMLTEQEGQGPLPRATDKVTVHYHGTFPDGSVFDSSRQRGQPATFSLSGIIPCWNEALRKMKVGGKAKLVCPPNLAYGDRGAPPRIPPGATLVFQVELIGIATE